MTVPAWRDREGFQEWWLAHAVEFNRLAVTNPAEWERVAQKVEAFQIANRHY